MNWKSTLGYPFLVAWLSLLGCAAPRMTFEANSDQPTSPTLGLHFERPPEDKPNTQQLAENDATANTRSTAGSSAPFGEHKRIPLRRTDQADEAEDTQSTPPASNATASETAPFSF